MLHNLPSQGLLASSRTRRGPKGTTDESSSDRNGASARGPGGCACRRSVALEPRPPPQCPSPAAVTPERPFDLVGVHWRGSGRVELRTLAASGTWSPWRLAAPESEDRPDRGVFERSPARLDGRQPMVGTRLDATGGAHRWHGGASARLVRAQPVRAHPAAHGGDGGLAEDRAEKRLERQREDRAERAALCARAALRPRSPYGRLQLVPARGIRGDRSRHRALSREGQRLERHRLQLSRRPLRPGLRGAGRRDAAQRHRRSRCRLQHRVRRRRRPRDVLGARPRLARRRTPSARCSHGAWTSGTSILRPRRWSRPESVPRIFGPSPGIGMPALRPVPATRCTRGWDSCERWR